MVSGAPTDFAGNFATNYVQSNIKLSNVTTVQNYQTATSLAVFAISPELSLTISLAQAAIQLAQAVIAQHTTSGSH
jgi:hypothetical protein